MHGRSHPMENIRSFLERNSTFKDWLWLLGYALAACLVVFLLLKIERKVFSKIYRKKDGIGTRFGERIVRFLTVFIAIEWVIMSSSLTRSFGSMLFQGTAIIAAITGFAAQPVISDMICGFMITATKPFEIGNRIELQDGTSGIVRDITLRHVVLQGIDTLKIVIPNSKMNQMKLINLSYQARNRSIQFNFRVAYHADAEFAMSVIQKAVMDSPFSVPKDESGYAPVYYMSTEPSCLIMTTLVYYEPSNRTEVVKSDINTRVKKALNANGIEIPHEYVNVVFKNNPESV